MPKLTVLIQVNQHDPKKWILVQFNGFWIHIQIQKKIDRIVESNISKKYDSVELIPKTSLYIF